MKSSSYDLVRESLKPGDLVAFGGRGPASAIIKMATRSYVSHVGIVLKTSIDWCDRSMVQVIESTSLGDGFAGVQVNRLSTRYEQYKGEMWVLPMLPSVYHDMNMKQFITWMTEKVGVAYDAPGAIMAGLDLLPDVSEDFSKIFCSELVSGGLQAGGAIADEINASEETPIDNCRYDVWAEPIQILGDPRKLC